MFAKKTITCFRISKKLFDWIGKNGYTSPGGTKISCLTGSGDTRVTFINGSVVQFWLQDSQISDAYDFPVGNEFASGNCPQWLGDDILEKVESALYCANLEFRGLPLAGVLLDGMDIHIYLSKKLYDWVASQEYGIWPLRNTFGPFKDDSYQITCSTYYVDKRHIPICSSTGLNFKRDHRGNTCIINSQMEQFEKIKYAISTIAIMYNQEMSATFPPPKNFTLFYGEF
jgi:hypothetical protein